ncbi:MAG: hypothetical protein HOP09_15790 [Hyphomicrobium sp.]|nr:hypothetical protein [Hyphomicrobium sp.]
MYLRVSLLLVCAIAAIAGAANCAFAAEPSSQTPQVQDFREVPLKYKEELAEKKLVPVLRGDYLQHRLEQIIRTVDVGTKWIGPTVESMRPRKPLSYHVVIRFDNPYSPNLFSNSDIPRQAGASGLPDDGSALTKIFQKYEKATDGSTSGVASILGLHPEPDPARADLLIHVNLADSQQASKDFSFEAMPTLPKRLYAGKPEQDLRGLQELTYALPWTIARLYYRVKGTAKGVERTVEGGEIWVQYPTRTYWQETVARHLFDDLALAQELGLGTNRRDIIEGFRTPHKTMLPPLVQSLGSQRPIWDAPRPNENLLTIASSAKQEYEFSACPRQVAETKLLTQFVHWLSIRQLWQRAWAVQSYWSRVVSDQMHCW